MRGTRCQKLVPEGAQRSWKQFRCSLVRMTANRRLGPPRNSHHPALQAAAEMTMAVLVRPALRCNIMQKVIRSAHSIFLSEIKDC